MDEKTKQILEEVRELNKQRKFQEALDLINKNIEDDPAVYNALGFIKMNLGKYKESLKDYDEAIKREKNSAFLYSNKAFVYFRMQDWKNTILELNNAIKKNPTIPEFYELRAKANMLNNNTKESLEDIEEAIKLAPTQEKFYEKKKEIINIIQLKTETDNIAENIFENAREHFKKKEFYTAAALLQKAISIKETGEFYELIGICKNNLNNFEEGLKDLEKAKKLDPKKDSIYRNIAKTLLSLGGMTNYKKSLKEYDTAIKLDPKPIWYFERSYVYIRLQENKKALEDINITLKFDPNNPMFLTRKGDIYAYSGNIDKAIEYYDKALVIDPLNKEIYDKKEGALLAKEKKIDFSQFREKGMYG
ncbi:tetratricopeptide repeat protein [Candidatus Micrarchaeota archaeon]|jgi:tetratricopeptide (TPR) repeat protein|nr:tetratricopeptide repeat protein [Candidatus Micrarchaeota archaeon]